jgi:DNA polymerase III delta' subunit
VAADTFPCREAVVGRLEALHAAGKLGQPLLFTGPEGVGKETTALELARRLDCAAPATCTPQRRCESCVKVLSFQHPDIRWIGPAPAAAGEADVADLLAAKQANPFHRSPWSATSQVAIGDTEHPGPMSVRSLIQFLRRRAFQSPWKVAIVADSQRMNTAAANAFLKTLEEPPPQSLIILLTTAPEGMLPTILSRCRKVPFDPWPAAELATLLQRHGGVGPTEALAVARAADGNARRALDLLEPVARMLSGWAVDLFAGLHRGDRSVAALAADDLHRGAVPPALLTDDLPGKAGEAKEPAERRHRAIQLCEMLNILYSDTVARRERGEDWSPRLADAAAAVDAAAARRSTNSLLADLARIDAARRDIDRNLNIGLVMALLGEDLIEHAQADRT